MSKKYLIDTCIWRDFYENRFSKAGNPFGKYAAKLFIEIIKHKDTIIFSETLVRELKKKYSSEEIKQLLNLLFLNKRLIKIDITEEEVLEAENLSRERNLPFVDCLNIVQARNHNAIVISQDKHYFEKLNDIARTVKPQEIS